jgi:hypothetical protein
MTINGFLITIMAFSAFAIIGGVLIGAFLDSKGMK